MVSHYNCLEHIAHNSDSGLASYPGPPPSWGGGGGGGGGGGPEPRLMLSNRHLIMAIIWT